jgi:hypothetical protein
MRRFEAALGQVLQRLEPYLFILLIGFNLIPIWSSFAFLTLDGQGHIYNGHLLMELLTNAGPVATSITEINTNFSPNWISHPLLALLSPLFAPFTIEKIMVSLQVVLFLYCYRYFSHVFFPQNRFVGLFGFLFVWTSALLHGFFNYNFGVAFLFLNLGLLKRYLDLPSTKTALFLAVITLLLYFSHLVAFGLFGIVGAFYMIEDAIRQKRKSCISVLFRKKNLYQLLLIFLLPALMLFNHLMMMSSGSSGEVLRLTDITERLYTLSGFNAVSDHEWVFSRWYYFILLPVVPVSMIIWKSFIKRKETHCHTIGIFSLFAFLIALIALTYTLPDGTALGGGMLTVRLVTFSAVIFFSILLSQLRLATLQFMTLIAFLIIIQDKMQFISGRMKEYDKICRVIDVARKSIDEGGLMFCADFYRRTPFGHVADVLGNNKDVVLSNTWLHKPFNPINWKEIKNVDPATMTWLDNQGKCLNKELEEMAKQQVKWYIIFGNPNVELYDVKNWEECRMHLETNYQKHFEIVDTLIVYKRLMP